MPVYCYKCESCGTVLEHLVPGMNAPRRIPHLCNPKAYGAGRQSGVALRHHASELPAAHTDGEYHFRPHYDAAAGEFFDLRSQERAFQERHRWADGSIPEPIEGKRKKAFVEEALHANAINKQPHFDEKAFSAELLRCHDETHAELSKRSAMGLGPPPIETGTPVGYTPEKTAWTD